MQRFLLRQSISFRHLVCQHFTQNFDLQLEMIKNWNTISGYNFCHQHLYTSPTMDRLVVSNKVINSQYNLSLDASKYSDVIVVYKNVDISLLKTVQKSKLPHNDIQTSFLIGRKYKTPHSTINNAFGLPVQILHTDHMKQHAKPTKNEKPLQVDISKMNAYRRVFQYHYNDALNKSGCENAIIFSLDTEYLNDVYDSWASFPEAEDHSNLFMIGVCDMNKKYTNFTCKRLNRNSENILLKSFFSSFLDGFQRTGVKSVLFHWSKAELTAFRKAVERNPDLMPLYKSFMDTVVFMDLMPIVKKTVLLESYSLKYVSKILLKKDYETLCQNGADVIIGIIGAEESIKGEKSHIETLSDDHRVVDIMKYNQMDTELLIDIYNFFMGKKESVLRLT